MSLIPGLHPSTEASAKRKSARWLVLAAVMLAYLPVVVDMTILHITIPSLTLALQATGTEVLWIIDIYPLLMAGLLIPMGTLADRIGHRKILLTGLAIFGLASLAAAYSVSATMLIVSRGALALGAAMIAPAVLALIRSTFDDEKERGFALGLWGTVSSAGAAVGPLVGGGLLEHFWWGAVFLINVPLVLIVWAAVFVLIPNRPAAAGGRWTIGQALVLIAGLIAIVYAIKTGVKPGASLPLMAAIFASGLALMTAFLLKQRSSTNPMLDLSLFAKPAIRTGAIMALVVSGALIGVELTIAQELQYVVGLTPFEAGMFMMPLMAAAAVGGPLGSVLLSKIKLRFVASGTLFIGGLSLAGLGMSDFRNAGAGIICYMALLGFSLSIGLTASSIAIMGSAPVEKAGAAGALEAGGYELGAALGVTAFGVLLGSLYRTGLAVPGGLTSAIPSEASGSIGETMIAAHGIGGEQGEMLRQAAKTAFATAHGAVLLSAAALLCLLALFVLMSLKETQDVHPEQQP
ncbi:MFS transporter [Altererythrobacter soli]|uniref:MFS transporter n=1 Tax=Croceibacterium soli TaxID=1739690 RepID=A0A6I4UU42_9SPHN|nr:MFS transporter [Croceibacterium soli]MXP42026.1 MFS transporter [Croceibacterium soli]